MPSKQTVSDEALSRALGMYAGMVGQVLTNPRRWLGVDEDPPLTAGWPARVLDAVRDRALGDVTPASPHWAAQPETKRVEWWIWRIAVGAALARERGNVAPADWVPLLAQVIFNRELAGGIPAPMPATEESEDQLETAASDTSEPPSGMAALAQGAQRVVRTLWRLAQTFLDLQDLFDERPRGGLLARTLAKLPVIGVAGGWLDERGAIRKAARQTQRLIA
jgi:hypothetical protein